MGARKIDEEESLVAVQLANYRKFVEIRNSMSSLDPTGNYKNIVGALGEFIAEKHYGFSRDANGRGFDAVDNEGRKIEVKARTNMSGQVEIKGDALAELLLVLHIEDDGTFHEVYFGPMSDFLEAARYHGRTNNYILTMAALAEMAHSSDDDLGDDIDDDAPGTEVPEEQNDATVTQSNKLTIQAAQIEAASVDMDAVKNGEGRITKDFRFETNDQRYYFVIIRPTVEVLQQLLRDCEEGHLVIENTGQIYGGVPSRFFTNINNTYLNKGNPNLNARNFITRR